MKEPVCQQPKNQKPVLCGPDKCEGWEWLDVDSDLSEILPGYKSAIEMYKDDNYLVDLVQ